MKTINLEINDKEYNVLVAETEEEKEWGLQDVIELESNEGMLFTYDAPQTLSFWMHNTEIELKIVFIDSDWVIQKVVLGKPLDDTPITCDNVQYVLELHPDANVHPGDEIDIEDNELSPGSNLDLNKMYVYGSDGNVQAQLMGGERIISIAQTKVCIRKAKKAYATKKEADYKSLGKYLFYVFKGQDEREPEYVEKKD